jgi:sugar phosphate isomerase/epimerase
LTTFWESGRDGPKLPLQRRVVEIRDSVASFCSRVPCRSPVDQRPPIHDDDELWIGTDLQKKATVYKPILDYAAAKGIVLGLEDDDELTRTSAQLLTIVKQVNHPAARIALDCGNFRKDGYQECEICAPYASSTHVKPQMSTADGQREPADWARLFGILANAGYRGYVSLELSTPDNPVPKYAAELIRCARMYSGA